MAARVGANCRRRSLASDGTRKSRLTDCRVGTHGTAVGRCTGRRMQLWLFHHTCPTTYASACAPEIMIINFSHSQAKLVP